MLKQSAWILKLVGDKVPPATWDSSEVVRTLNRRCYPHSGHTVDVFDICVVNVAQAKLVIVELSQN